MEICTQYGEKIIGCLSSKKIPLTTCWERSAYPNLLFCMNFFCIGCKALPRHFSSISMLCMLCPDGVRFISVLEVYHILGSFSARPGFCWVLRGGLTQPTGTKWVTDKGKMPCQSSTQPTKNKTFSNKLGWDKRSVPNVLKEEFFLLISIQ